MRAELSNSSIGIAQAGIIDQNPYEHEKHGRRRAQGDRQDLGIGHLPFIIAISASLLRARRATAGA